ncbi:hypothetical protein Tco_1160883 [Tanacetum coccineum]
MKRRTILKTDEDAKRKNLGVQHAKDIVHHCKYPRRSLKKRNITPSKNELPHIGSNVAFEENMISRFNIGVQDGQEIWPEYPSTRRGESSMRESVQGKPPHKHIDLPGDRFIPSSSMSKSGKDILVFPIRAS